ncbi:MAG: twin-arginine translocase subunit TatC [Firmicutes bacterium HGW-Firmicutes-12]|nr:MAG: twin-arginine translocase subunit TatC [Firmicutes bacterium HGW-Firmicutes-12]
MWIGDEMDEKKTTLFEHLQELRRVIIISLLTLFLGMVISYAFLRNPLMTIVFNPIKQFGKELVVIGVTEGFMVQLKIALIGGIAIASPIITWQVMGFILPAFYSHERKVFWISFCTSLILFIAGIMFGYMLVLELGLRILLFEFTEGLTVMISAGRYLSFFSSLLLPFGIIFQLPLAAYLLGRIGIVSASKLRKKRSYVILAIFLLAAVLSPGGDIVSQILFALPMLLLYEVSILLTAIFGKKT